jgi:serine/threonine protein kinase
LGSGRHGAVRRLQVRFDRQFGDYVVKFYQQEESQEEDLEQFAVLIQVFWTLSHPCLATCVYWDAPTTEMGPVLWTDYFNDGSLGAYLKHVRLSENVRRFTPTELVLIICGFTLRAVALHARDLFHGNLKASDILLHFVDSEWTVHVTDYISHSLEHSYLPYSCLVSSPNYTAPESYELEDADSIIQKRKCFSALQ